ncbi:GCG_CRPN prefix-to-repeats domain-containing protein [Sphingomonas sp. 22R3R2A-7]|uniref:GCG_CRPN prefix-to-repeats domain-containing protein n=1 Tax=Sphingomonas sp. 22R3R2A-7 TaxID=3050230 RepID=UPI002FE21435
MRTILLAALAAGAALTVSVPADARQGCGVGAHRGPGGYCRPNRGRVVVAPRVVVGRYYHGRGYWDGRRYWGQRYRWHGGWRYR